MKNKLIFILFFLFPIFITLSFAGDEGKKTKPDLTPLEKMCTLAKIETTYDPQQYHLTLTNKDEEVSIKEQGTAEKKEAPQINKKIMKSIMELTQLRELTFKEEDPEKKLVVDFSQVSLSSLKGLTKLTLNNVSFLGENFDNLTLEGYKIKFKEFVKELKNLPSLQGLDLSNNSNLIPHLKLPPGRKALEPEPKHYNECCKKHLTECAQLLVSNFSGRILIMTNSNLGPFFICAYLDKLASSPHSRIKKVNFDGNPIKPYEAVFSLAGCINKGAREIILFSNDQLQEFKNLLLQHLLGTLEIE